MAVAGTIERWKVAVDLGRGGELCDAYIRHRHATGPAPQRLLRALSRPRIPKNQLSERELDTIHLAAEGLTVEDTAARLQLKFETIRSHRKSALTKLRARDMAHAVELTYAARHAA